MSASFYLIPISLVLGLVALVGFFWTLRNGQYNDPEGDAHRILTDEDDRPLNDNERRHL
ncbi:cbb3-type cytochrome oxidase assembly protein CcoS [Sulfitobacter sp. SK012]|uniref:cbb3-type cytochrome oxidase assembly protein CcoS n=1 Tax=Sulfitobacter sp. SK012 TaxID=1389005 RepID=UPI000E0C099E|nr:cbb3-type cytochrome oxidase assembly protein CcoS [Sulfitobacter sp. SK012]AXI48587.1 cbb3-type cytochrome oxidase assembly protein CcoS [Sulfitobacter sp. SK012]